MMMRIDCAITVMSPESLRTMINSHSTYNHNSTIGVLDHSIATFGRIDYRKNEVYQIVRASETKGCGALESVSSTYKVALFVERGECYFAQKAHLAERVSKI